MDILGRDKEDVVCRAGWLIIAVYGLAFSHTSTTAFSQDIHTDAEVLVESVSKKLEQRDFLNATSLLQDADVRTLAFEAVKSGSLRYIAVSGYGKMVPGIPKWRAEAALNAKNIVYLRGTSDYAKDSIEDGFQNEAVSFASRFNMFLRYYGTQVADDKGEVGMQAIQEQLSLTTAAWEDIPLHARLAIRNIVEQLIAKENDIDKALK